MSQLASYHHQRLWFIDSFERQKLYKEGPVYHNVPLVCCINGEVDIDKLKLSTYYIAKRHEILRTRIKLIDETLVQIVEDEIQVNDLVKEIIVSDKELYDVNGLILNEANKAFDLKNDFLFRCSVIKSSETTYIIFIFHYLIIDNYSLTIFTNELKENYDLLIAGREISEKELKLQYSNFSKWQLNLSEKVLEPLMFYWKKQLKGKISPIKLHTDKKRAHIHIYKHGSVDFEISKDTKKKIKEFCVLKGLDEQDYYLACYKILLHKLSKQEEIVVGTLHNNRDSENLKECIGPISNLLVIRDFVSKDDDLGLFLQKIKDTLDKAVKYHHVPFEYLANQLRPEVDMSRTVFFDHFFHYDHESKMNFEIGGNQVHLLDTNMGWGKYDLNMYLHDTESSLKGIFTYNSEYYNVSTIQYFAECYVNICTKLIQDSHIQIKDFNINPNQRHEELVFKWNETQCCYPDKDTITSLFNKIADRYPDRIAISYEDKNISYRMLKELSNKFAFWLREKYGIQENNVVAFYLSRNELPIIAMLGILKAGGVYLPIDPSYSKENRIKFILKDSGAALFINSESNTTSDHNIKTVEFNLEELLFDKNIKSEDITYNIPAQNAYIIYTSGTTGIPKGCIVKHENVVRLIVNDHNPFDFNIRDKWTIVHSFGFDFSVWEVYGPLLTGGTAVIIGLQDIQDVKIFNHLLSKFAISVLNQTPLAFYNLIEEQSRNKENVLDKHLRYVCFGGEKLELKHLEQWAKIYSLKNISLVNMYGITETTVHVTFHLLTDNELSPDYIHNPIGKPLPETTLYVLENDLSPSPYFVEGELFVGGTGVSNGYLNRPELTNSRFLINPFNKSEIIYKSGDLGFRDLEGNVYYKGRADSQIKLRGFRIEIGEIEANLLKIELIEKVIVLDKKDSKDELFLIAFFTSSHKIDGDYIRRELHKKVPEYMIPRYFHQIKEFPITSTGKVDREKLLNIKLEIKRDNQNNQPQNQLQHQLVSIWKEVLEINDVGINDNFFDIGGDSIKGMRVINKIQDKLEEIVHVASLFEFPTIYEFSKNLESYREKETYKLDNEKLNEYKEILKYKLKPIEIENKLKLAVFILSPHRSGSTLLRVILAGHSNLFAPPELELLNYNNLTERSNELATNYMSEGLIRALMELSHCNAEDAIRTVESWTEQDINNIEVYKYLQDLSASKILVDKTPSYAFDIEVLNRMEKYFDKVKYIHLIRHPNAVIKSMVEAKIDQVLAAKTECSITELGEILWNICHKNILEFLGNIPDNRKHTVSYESLVQNPERIVKDICNFLEIGYESQMLDIYDDSKSRITDGIYSESKMIGDVKFFTHNKINPGPANNWKNAESIELSEISIDLATKLGYTFSNSNNIFITEKSEFYEMSNAQKRLWFADELEKGKNSYNISHVYKIKGRIDIKGLEYSFTELTKRHEILRTNFVSVNDEPLQRVYRSDEINFNIDLVNCDNNEQLREVIKYETNRKFDLSGDLLFRAKLINLNEEEKIIIVVLHHIIFDGWSTKIFFEEFFSYYDSFISNRKLNLKPLKIQYKEFSSWQNNLINSKEIKVHKDYWLEKLSGELPVLDFPTDYERPQIKTNNGNSITYDFNKETLQILKQISAKHNSSLYITLVAALKTLLYKYTNQTDIVIGSPFAGRYHPDLENQIGYYINTIALRTKCDKDFTFSEFLEVTRETVLEASNHQVYPFEKIIEDLELKRNTSRNPVFDIVIILQNNDSEVDTDRFNFEFNLEPYPNENATSKFDLIFSFKEYKGNLSLNIEFNTDLYKEERVIRMFKHMEQLISSINEDINTKLCELDILDSDERKFLLYEFNNSNADKSKYSNVIERFKRQCSIDGDKIAIECNDRKVDYNELDDLSDKLAAYLIDRGICKNSVVGILMDRSKELIVSFLAVLKAGATYLPIDINTPYDRVRYMLNDCRSQVLISTPNLGNSYNELIEVIEPINQGCYHSKLTNKEIKIIFTDPAYIIYTSGSTGKPKGVIIEHGSLLNYVEWAASIYVKGETLGFPLFSSHAFDISVTSIYTPLITGNTIHIYAENEENKSLLLNSVISDNKSGVIKATPSHFKALRASSESNMEACQFKSVKRIIIGGEQLSTELADWIFNYFDGNVEIYNEYGPTEATVGCMIYKYDPSNNNSNAISIGKPMNNSKIYILNDELTPVPYGVNGELYISGDVLARGYLNNIELTATSFIQNPFKQDALLYKTGDYAYFGFDGNIQFIGRKDSQVKINGYRVELEEIEERIMQYNSEPDFVHQKSISTDNSEPVKRCSKCFLSSNFPGITFDHEGKCNFCEEFENSIDHEKNTYFKTSGDLKDLLDSIKVKSNKYDCLLLFSGGKDSTYVLYRLIDMGLRVLTFTFDNGFISDKAFENIKKITSNLNVDNIIMRSDNMNEVFIESLKSESSVCHGCWNALNTIGAKVAKENNINIIFSGLSVGQIYEMRLEELYKIGIKEESKIEDELKRFRKKFHSNDNRYYCILNSPIEEDYIDAAHFIDYFRYDNSTEEEILNYLIQKNWEKPKDTGMCSSNCLINDVGIYIHLLNKKYHFYEQQVSWDYRLGHVNREEGIKELDYKHQHDSVNKILSDIGYFDTVKVDNAIVTEFKKDGGALCAYYVANRFISNSDFKEYLSGYLNDYMIPSHFIRLKEMPLNKNGKIDIGALPKPDENIYKKIEKPVNEIEKQLLKIWSNIFDIDVSKIGTNHSFFELGGQSLKAVSLISIIHKEYNVRLNLSDVFNYPTIKQLASKILGVEKVEYYEILKSEKKDYYPLSSAQVSMFTNQIFNPKSTAYNVSQYFWIDKSISPGIIEKTLNEIIQRYDSLRAFFMLYNHKPVQRINDKVFVDLHCIDAHDKDVNDLINNFKKPFDLKKAPLFRAYYFYTREEKNFILFDFHHIIIDGRSIQILKDMFFSSLDNLQVKNKVPKLQYTDYINWYSILKNSDAFNKMKSYWLEELSNNKEKLSLPYDFESSNFNIMQYNGETLYYSLDKTLSDKILNAIVKLNTTPFVYFLTIYNILLHKVCNQDIIKIGTATANREHADLNDLIGMFVNMVIHKNNIDHNQSFKQLLDKIKENSVQVIQNQSFPYEELIALLVKRREGIKDPLINTSYMYNDLGYKLDNKYNRGKTEFASEVLQDSKYDISLNIAETQDGFYFQIDYDKGLFLKQTIEDIMTCCIEITNLTFANPDIRIKDISLSQVFNTYQSEHA